eukprot:494111_1
MKFGLLLASHIIEEWRQYYISYDVLKKTINRLKEEIYGTDNESIDSDHSLGNKCGIFTSIFLYCFECCLSKSPDADVVEQHDENLLNKQESKINTPTADKSHSLFKFETSKNKTINVRYASLERPFTLIQRDKNKEKDEKQSLIHNAYSPPISSYNNMSDDEKKQPLAITTYDTKEIAIKEWIKIIEKETNKVNKFYLDIESQLLSEYEQILHKLDKLRKIVEAKHKNINNINIKSESKSEAASP